MNTPVLLITWRRPDTLLQVINNSYSSPSRVYVACDGPNSQRVGEAKKVSETRMSKCETNWPCEIEYLYSDTNLDVAWVLVEQFLGFLPVEEGIILEDDCIPHPDFFGFVLLETHRFDNRAVFVVETFRRANGVVMVIISLVVFR